MRLSLLVLLLPALAHANMAAVQRYASQLTLSSEEKTPLVVEREDLRFDCEQGRQGDADRAHLVCRFEAIYTLHNPTEGTEGARAIFYGMRSRDVTVLADGLPVKSEASEVSDEVLTRYRSQRERQFLPRAGTLQAIRFELTLEPGERRGITLSGVTEPGERFIPRGYFVPAIEARHLLLATPVKEEVYDLEYFIAPIRTWAGDPAIHVQVTTPKGMTFELAEAEAWEQTPVDERVTARRTYRASEAPDVLQLAFNREAPVFNRGGAQLALGAHLGRDAGFRMRAGWQIAAPPWVLYSLSAETDFSQQLVFTPLAQIATGSVLILPSIGLGLGLPVQVTPDLRLGGRALIDVHLMPIGFVFAADYYPVSGASPSRLQLTLMAQIGL